MDRATEVALFKYQVIAPLLGPAAPGETQRTRIAAIAERLHTHPVRGPIRLGYGTIEEWYYFYRREGLAGLRPKSRKDRGKSRSIDEVLAEEILAPVRERPQLDGPGILAEIAARSGRDKTELPSLSTLYRFLRAEGLADRRRPPGPITWRSPSSSPATAGRPTSCTVPRSPPGKEGDSAPTSSACSTTPPASSPTPSSTSSIT
jgi:putative transposase